MSKMSTDPVRHALNGETMGTRWTALFYTDASVDPAPIQHALQAAVDTVDTQMSTWKPQSDLMRFNAAKSGQWVGLPRETLQTIGLGLQIGQASGGAFDIAMGDAVTAWGFGPEDAGSDAIQTAMSKPRTRAENALEIDVSLGCARKSAPIALDLNGIAKGYGVDMLADTLKAQGISDGLVGIDGEMRAMGLKPDGAAWTIAVEAPERGKRAIHSVLDLQDAAVATSGDYRHWVEVHGHKLSHTMDPRKGRPLLASPASVTVIARSCAEADAWATAFMVLGPDQSAPLAKKFGLNALFLMRSDDDTSLHPVPLGALFENGA